MDKALLDLERWLDKKKIMDYEVTIYGTDPYVSDSDVSGFDLDMDEIESQYTLSEKGVDET